MESNTNIRFEISKQSILDQLIEQENYRLKYQNLKLGKANEDIEKFFTAKNEEISRLKNYNQDLKAKIEKFKDNEE